MSSGERYWTGARSSPGRLAHADRRRGEDLWELSKQLPSVTYEMIQYYRRPHYRRSRLGSEARVSISQAGRHQLLEFWAYHLSERLDDVRIRV